MLTDISISSDFMSIKFEALGLAHADFFSTKQLLTLREVVKKCLGKYTLINVLNFEYWAVKSQRKNKPYVAEMRMLSKMSGNTRRDRIMNDNFIERRGIASIGEKMVNID